MAANILVNVGGFGRGGLRIHYYFEEFLMFMSAALPFLASFARIE
jgi:hypothetical protein